jgi:hypothetical protein
MFQRENRQPRSKVESSQKAKVATVGIQAQVAEGYNELVTYSPTHKPAPKANVQVLPVP